MPTPTPVIRPVAQRPPFNRERQTESSLERQETGRRERSDSRQTLHAPFRLSHQLRNAPAVSNRLPVSDIRIVSTLCPSKPGLTPRNIMNVRSSKAAPANKTSAKAISTTTKIDRALF